MKVLNYEWDDNTSTWNGLDTAFFWLANSISTVFIVSNYETNQGTGQKEAYIRYYDPTGLGVETDDPAQNRNQILLHQNYPNPFDLETTISFILPESQAVKLEVLNVLGQKVNTVFEGNLPACAHNFNWNGRDEKGNELNSGVYFYRLAASENIIKTRQMLILH